MSRRIAAIVNPYAAQGRAGKLWPQMALRLRERLGGFSERRTASSGHATSIARELIESGYDLIVAVGGDGTVSEVANGFLRDDEPIRPDAQLGILPVGTGSDFQRTTGLPSDMDAAIEILAGGKPLAIDVGKATFVAPEGQAGQRYFVNLTSFGMGGAVAARAKNVLTAVSGKAAFFWATLRTVATFYGRQVELGLDNDERLLSCFVLNVAVGNGRFHGGGMHPCPRALLNDGLLDVTIVDYLNPWEVVRDIRVLYSEDVYRHPKVHHRRARRLTARATRPTWIEVDGEPLGRLPLQIEVLPGRIPLLLSPSSPLFEAAAGGLP